MIENAEQLSDELLPAIKDVQGIVSIEPETIRKIPEQVENILKPSQVSIIIMN
jgi:hypothetical protein